MPDFKNVQSLILFLVFFMPGFLSIIVWDLIVPGEQRDFTKSAVSAIGFSALHWSVFWWLGWTVYEVRLWEKEHILWTYVLVLVVMVFYPVFWPIFFRQLLCHTRLSRYVVQPMRAPWDNLFGRGKPYWMIAHLKDGTRIHGLFSDQSAASVYPAPHELYMEQVCGVDQEGRFTPIPGSKGILILESELSLVELIEAVPTTPGAAETKATEPIQENDDGRPGQQAHAPQRANHRTHRKRNSKPRR